MVSGDDDPLTVMGDPDTGVAIAVYPLVEIAAVPLFVVKVTRRV
jgi:hypothetical protein